MIPETFERSRYCSATLKSENTVRYLGVDIEDALMLAKRIET
jgi:hypothetical protein